MILTGKAKEDFREYFESNNDYLGVGDFYNLPLSMQWGVYVDFFDSVNIITPVISQGWECFYTTWRGNMQQFKTRAEARKAAIEKACEIYNQKFEVVS